MVLCRTDLIVHTSPRLPHIIRSWQPRAQTSPWFGGSPWKFEHVLVRFRIGVGSFSIPDDPF